MPSLLHLPHERPLLPGVFLGRRKRFLADVRLADGRQVVAHCVNPGRMEGMVVPGAPVWVSRAPEGAKRKLAFTLELMRIGRTCIGANTLVANRIVAQLLQRRLLAGCKRYDQLQRERAFGDGGRVDFWLRRGLQETFLEVKNCHLVYPDACGYFPDSVSARATRHLTELSRLAQEGHRAMVCFVVQHPGARALRPSDVHDPAFAQAARAARQAGVRFRAVCVRPSARGYRVEGEVPVDLRPYELEPVRGYRARLDETSGSEW